MFEVKSDDFKKYVSFVIMLIVAAIIIVIVGEVCKHILPSDTAFFLTINKVYFLAAGTLVLMAGLNWLGLNSLRNWAVLFVGLLALIVVLFFADKLACSVLWGGVYASVLQRVPEQYFDVYYKALDGLSVVIAAIGVLLLLVKSLDVLKDVLSGTKKA